MNKWYWKSYQDLTKEELYKILAVRQEVFIVEQNIAYVDCDHKDQHSLHCWATDAENNIVAYLRIVKPGYKYQEPAIGRVLTIPSARGTGLGKEIMHYAIDVIYKEFGHVGIRISAQQYLEKFYMNLGFETVSEPYLEEDIDHIEMLKSTN